VPGTRRGMTRTESDEPESRYDAGPFVPRRADLAALREAAGGCRGCPLHREATQTVFGPGDADARVVLLGEQPGDQEDRRGEPFVGPAGKVLTAALEEAGIDPGQTYVTNAVKHFKFELREERGKRRIHKPPSLREMTACRPWLTAELALLDPQVIVALGATAGKALLGSSFRVTRQRGLLLSYAAPAADGAAEPARPRSGPPLFRRSGNGYGSGMSLTFTLDPPVGAPLRDGICSLWADVANAGGAVGFVPPVTTAAVRGDLLKHLVAMDEGRARLLVGTDAAGEVRATAFLVLNEHRLMRHWLWLHTVMVHPGLQGRGVGRELMAAAAESARGLGGLGGIRLTCRGGTGAEHFYAACGYKEVGRVPDAIKVADDDHRDDVTMWLPLV